jgi:hypothetical protein
MHLRFLLACLHGLLWATCLQAQHPCQIKIPADVLAIRKTPAMERHGGGKTYWICGNSKVVFRTGNATIFIESGCNVSLNDGSYTIYAKDGASIYIGVRCQANILREPNVRINGGITINGQLVTEKGKECPVLNYDYSDAPAELCPKLPIRELASLTEPTLPTKVPEKEIPNTPIETPTQDSPAYDDRYVLSDQAQVVKQTSSLYQSNKVYWVCGSGTLWINGDNNRIYIESGAKVSVTGSRNVILMKKGGALSLGNGGKNELLYMEDTDLKDDRSKATKYTKLQSITFQTSAVSNGCQ